MSISEKQKSSEGACKRSENIISGGPSVVTSESLNGRVQTPRTSSKRNLSLSADAFVPLQHKKLKVVTGVQITPATQTDLNSTKTKLSFAEKAGALAEDDQLWCIQRARKAKNIRPVTGTNQSTSLKGVKTEVQDYWDLTVTRLAPETTSAIVKTELEKHGINVHDVAVWDSKRPGTKSVKVRVHKDNKDKTKADAIWPEFVEVQDWVPKPKGKRLQPGHASIRV